MYLSDCYSMRFTTLWNYHLIDWWCDVNFCLFTWWFEYSSFVTAIWDGKPVDSNSHRLSPLYYKHVWWINRSKVLKRNSIFQESNNVKYFKEMKTFEESSKSRGVFKPQAGIGDIVFLWISLTAHYFHNKSSIIDVGLGYI